IDKTVKSSTRPIILLMDTYERLASIDEWICETLVRMLPVGVRPVLVGRDRLEGVDFRWTEYGEHILSYELPELDRPSAYAYLSHHGLNDKVLLEQTYGYT